MESMSGSWPWLTLIAAVAGFAVGYFFGKPRFLASWGGQPACGAACNCGGPACAIPVGGASPHVHCPNQGKEVKCAGTCIIVGGAHAIHFCSDGHTF
jgi:hypothetical protein